MSGLMQSDRGTDADRVGAARAACRQLRQRRRRHRHPRRARRARLGRQRQRVRRLSCSAPVRCCSDTRTPRSSRPCGDQLERGTTFLPGTSRRSRLAEAIVEHVPCAEAVTFHSTGSEATFFALRLARAFRRRDTILKFEGGYHGMSDHALMSTQWTQQPGTVPAGRARFERHSGERAGRGAGRAVQRCRDGRPPHRAASRRARGGDRRAVAAHDSAAPGFLEELRVASRRTTASCSIFDEVVTGFRLAFGGAQNVLRGDARSLRPRQEHRRRPPARGDRRARGHHVVVRSRQGRRRTVPHPDRHAVGQSRGGGGRPGDSGGPAATRHLREGIRYRARTDGRHFRHAGEGRPAGAGDRRAAAVRRRVCGRRRRDYRSTLRADAEMGRRFNRRFRAAGILKGESKFYVSLAHDAADVRHTLDAVTSAVKAELAETRVPAQ